MGINCSLNQNKKLEECMRSPKPFIPYFGGKSRAADKIISKFPDHKIYVEPFVGGGSIYWKNNISKKSVINDLDKDIIKIYKDAKNSPNKIERCKIEGFNKHNFNKAKRKNHKSSCDVVKMYHHSFAGNGGSYADRGMKKMMNKEVTKEHQNKLRKTKIYNKDFREVMKKHDSKKTLHYLDPPYVGQGKRYKIHGVTPKEVCDTAKKMKGKVVISYDNNAEVKRSCRGLKISKISFPYSADPKNHQKNKTELLIKNF